MTGNTFWFPERRRRLTATAVSFLVALGVAWIVVGSRPLLYDNDSYYHLAIAELFSKEGPTDHLESVRASALSDGFGDKEVLYHLGLVPLVRVLGALEGAKVALVATLALLASMITFLAYKSLGGWAIVLPLWIPFASTEMGWRLVRLRPENLSLLMMLVAMWLAASRRFRWLLLVSFLYALTYTAFHALLGLLFLLALFWGLARRQWDPALVIYPALGAGLALIVHPHFPKNLEIWILQSFDFFRNKDQLDVGSEILPNITDVALMANLGLIGGLILLWCSTSEDGRQRSEEQSQLANRLAEAFTLAAFLFLVLYLLMSRFSLYLMPLATLAVVLFVDCRGRRLASRTRLPFQGRSTSVVKIPSLVTLLIVVLVSLPDAKRQLTNFRQRTDAGPDRARTLDREQLSALLPTGARVAARWQQTPIYMLWAPQGRYLNVLDPVFQAIPFPELYAAQRELFAGETPDSPLLAVAQLDSEYLAYSAVGAAKPLTRRLEHDPRVDRLHNQSNLLFRVVPERNADFVLDWWVVPGGHNLPVSGTGSTFRSLLEGWPIYPRASEPTWASVEGFVDANRIPNGEPCVALARHLDEDARGLYELAPYGPTQLWVGQTSLARTNGSLGAFLGEGIVVSIDPTSGTSPAATPNLTERPIMTVLTCSSGPAQKRGFYLRRLPR